jgi:hypothetical protein
MSADLMDATIADLKVTLTTRIMLVRAGFLYLHELCGFSIPQMKTIPGMTDGRLRGIERSLATRGMLFKDAHLRKGKVYVDWERHSEVWNLRHNTTYRPMPDYKEHSRILVYEFGKASRLLIPRPDRLFVIQFDPPGSFVPLKRFIKESKRWIDKMQSTGGALGG